MRKNSIGSLLTALMLLAPVQHAGAQATAEEEIRRLETEIRLAEARKRKAEAEAAAIEAENKARDALATQQRQADKDAKLAVEASTQRKQAEFAEDLVTLKALKETLGEPPSIGKEGTVSMSDATTAQLLRVRGGSLVAASRVAEKLCVVLSHDGVTNAFLAPGDLASKLQGSRVFTAELNDVKALAADGLKRMRGIQVQAVAQIVSALAAARYLVGGVDQLTRLFRTDYSLAVANTSRNNLLEYVVAKKCPEVLGSVNVEGIYRMNSMAVLQTYRTDLDEMLKFVREHKDKGDGLVKAIDDDTSWLQEQARKPEGERNASQFAIKKANLEANKTSLKELKSLDTDAQRVKGYLESLAGKEAVILDALVWSQYDSDADSLKLAGRDRVSYVLSAQDIQITKDNAFVGKRISGSSTVEVIFQATSKDGAIKSAGAISETVGGDSYDLAGANDINIGSASCLKREATATEVASNARASATQPKWTCGK